LSQLRSYFDRASIRFQLFRLVVAIATATLFISMAGGALFEWNNQQKQVTQSLVTIAQAASVAASAAVAFHDSIAAGEALRILIAQKEIEAAAVYMFDGNRLASYGDDVRLPNQVDPRHEHLPSFDLFKPATTLLKPIRLDDATIGYIFIRASLKDYRSNYLQQASLAIGANLLGLLLVLGFGLRFLDRIVNPVKQLADTSRQVRADKNFSLRATAPATNAPRDEIGELVISFNAMLAEIERREQALNGYQTSLEGMVLERTNALLAANVELQSAKEAAEAATVAKSRFLAAASHDLRQPIQAINLFQNALNRSGLTDEQQRISDYLTVSAQSLGELLNTLLDISKLDAGAIVASPHLIDVHELFSNIDAEFAPLAAAKSLRFKLFYPHGVMALFTDLNLLHALLRNLIGNAIKYTEQGGILVALRRRGDQAVMQVWDSGIGIAAEHLDPIFDEYFQVANPERDKTKGLGLGLSIVKRQARLLATEIVCHSRLGRGSVFEFRLPLADKSLQALARPRSLEATQASLETSLLGRHIAVIDDDFMVAKATQVILESFGMTAATYGSAEEALADAKIARADFYISDLRLPGANGIELLDAIQQRASKRIKAVLLTGDTSPEQIEMVQSSQWPVLFKPVDLPTLLAAIESHSALH
jgi:signal transduction histidine kinase